MNHMSVMFSMSTMITGCKGIRFGFMTFTTANLLEANIKNTIC